MSVKLWRVSFHAVGANGEDLVNVVHVKDDDSPGGSLAGATDAASTMNAWLGTVWRGMHVPATTCETITVREVVREWLGETPSGAIHGVHLAGTMGGTRDGKLDPSLCIRGSTSTDVPKRYARGGIFYGPSLNSSDLDSTGQWIVTSTYYNACKAFSDALLAGHDRGTPPAADHFSYIVYSLTRHKAAASTYYFDAKSVTLKRRIARLNSRNTVP